MLGDRVFEPIEVRVGTGKLTSTADQPRLLLQSKLQPPYLKSESIPRPGLCARLDRVFDARIALVVAPAGSGKSQLVADWLKSVDRPAAWLSLDGGDMDLARFVEYLLAAISSVYPDSVPTARKLLYGMPTLRADDLVVALLYDLSLLPGSLILVLDDYHAAENSDVQALMAALIADLPAPLHLVLLSRRDPLLPLARLRSQLQLVEIRISDLRFSQDESAALLDLVAGRELDDRIVSSIFEFMEGWVVGLQLASILLRETPDPDRLILQFTEHGHRWLTEYLVGEVVDKLSQPDRELLFQAARLEQFSAPLLEYCLPLLQEREGGADFLDRLLRANLFVIPLESAGNWYRFHHLFRDVVLQISANIDSIALYRRASQWFEKNGMFDDAMAYALAAQDIPHAVRIVEKMFPLLTNQENWRPLERWLAMLPHEALETPTLLIVQAACHQFHNKLRAIPSLLARAETGLAAEMNRSDYTSAELDAWRGALLTLRTLTAVHLDAIIRDTALTSEALRLLPQDWRYMSGLAELSHILSLQRMGHAEEALAFGQECLVHTRGRPTVRTCRVLLGLCGLLWFRADATELLGTAERYRQIAQGLNSNISLVWSHFMSGWAHYQRNELEAAEIHFGAVIADREIGHQWAVVDSYSGLVLTFLATGRLSEAQTTIDDMRDYLTRDGALQHLPRVDSLGLRLALAEGDPFATSPLNKFARQTSSDNWEAPALTAVLITLSNGWLHELPEADKILTAHRERAYQAHNHRLALEVSVLTVLLHILRNEPEAALQELTDAVALAEPGGVVRSFVDAGPGLRPLLEQLLTRKIHRAHVARILAAYDSSRPLPPSTATLSSGPPVMQGEEIGTSLTFREAEVLELMAERLTNQEIADRLTLSLNTVKKYSQRIFRKLGVKNRRQAIARAYSLGLVSGETQILSE